MEAHVFEICLATKVEYKPLKRIKMRRIFVQVLVWIGLCVSLIGHGGAQAQDDLTGLLAEGNAAFSTGDYVTAMYYYQRVLENDDWKNIAQRIDVLRKLAMIEESQAHFEQAANHYRRLIDILPAVADAQNQVLRDYYLQRYAENLERIGMYEQAGTVLWQLIRESDSTNRPVYLKQLVENCGFQTLDEEKIAALQEQILPDYLDSVGWEFAELLRGQGKNQESLALFEKLWPANPERACEFVHSILELYVPDNQLDVLLSRIRLLRSKDIEQAPLLVQFEVALLEEAGRGEEAFKQLDRFLIDTVGDGSVRDTEKLLVMIPGKLIDRWIDLMVRYEGHQTGIDVLTDIVKKVPMDLNRRKKLADLFIEDGRQKDAIQLWSQWALEQSNTPTAVLHAAQEIFSLGDAGAARELIERQKKQIPPPLAWKQGQTALQLSDYAGAFASFQIAVASGGIPPSMITSVIHQFAQTKVDHDELIAGLVQAATARPFSSIPEWIKTPLLQFGVQARYRDQLQSLADIDETGVWKYNIAIEAIQHGDLDWALSLLNGIPPESLYRVLADRKRAEILGQDPSMTAQRTAADLMLSSLADILSSSGPIKLNPTILDQLLEYSEMRLNAYQANEALVAVHSIESSSDTLEHPLSDLDRDRIRFDRARALSQLASFGPAIELLETIRVSPYEEDAQFLLARIYLAQRKTDLATTLLHEIVENPRYWRRANDALAMIVVLEPLVGDSLQLLSDAVMYELQGRFASAIPSLRQLAVEGYGSDVEEWSRYYIGKLKRESGDSDSAREEWERLLVDVDHPVIQGMTRLGLLQLGNSSSAKIADMTEYQELMIQLPNSLFSDLARLQMQRKFGKEQP